MNENDKKKLQDVIDMAEDDMLSTNPELATTLSLGKRSRIPSASKSSDHEGSSKEHGEAHVTASVGSNEDLDFLDEDLLRNRESMETGYVGQNSEVQWLRSVQRQSQQDEGEPSGLPYGPPGTSKHANDARSKALHQRREEGGSVPIRHVTDASFYLDSDNIELDIVVNPYELPDPDIAEQLVVCYMSTIHSTFPVLPRSFEDQARRFIASLRQNRAFHVPDRWRALLNLIFAIGAKYSHLTRKQWQGDERDHLVYMTRASHLLNMNSTVMFISSPDLVLVQATAVFSVYFLTIGHVSRAWLMIGVSIRLAMALGLHVRNEDPSADAIKKEMLLRTWWSLHSIECLVSSITGRPPTISNSDCTVPLPAASLEHEQPLSKRRPSGVPSQRSYESSQTSSSAGTDEYLVNTTKIEVLTQNVLASLYAPRTASRSWQDVQISIKELLHDLEAWSAHAFSGAKTSTGPQRHSQVEREHLILLMHYWSTKILITRPCLCRTERRIQNESDASASFNVQMANICVTSARQLVSLFPAEPDLDFVYVKAPWWSVIHLFMQCAAVLLLEIGYQAQHTKDDNASITADIQRLINWLHVMRQDDPVAGRAHSIVRRILQNVAPILRDKASELLDKGSADSASNRQTPGFHDASQGNQNNIVDWAQGNLFDGSASVKGHQYYPQDVDQSSFGSAQPSQGHSAYGDDPLADLWLSGTFGNPFINSWDESIPWGGIQSPRFNASTLQANQEQDIGDMNLYPGSNVEQVHPQQQQSQQYYYQGSGWQQAEWQHPQ
ncbi:hypothetical protein E8E11_007367 [Didymella keratinophila]|nr:hypothetical protein E8E11_007367 [Didymella keratinophila]